MIIPCIVDMTVTESPQTVDMTVDDGSVTMDMTLAERIVTTAPRYEGENVVIPSDEAQTLPTEWTTVYQDIIVAAIPAAYHNTSDADITADTVLNGHVGYNAAGRVEGAFRPIVMRQDAETGVVHIE